MNCAVCGDRAVHMHHVIYRQHLDGADPLDENNLLPVCFRCHERHHNASRRIPVSALTDENLAFARGLLGLAAFDYFTRRYQNDDERLYELLEETAA